MKYKYCCSRLGISAENEDILNNICSLADSILKDHDPLFIKDLAVKGNDLITIGITGHRIGEILNMLLEEVLLNPENNKKDILLTKAKG